MFAPGNHEIENATHMCPLIACGPDSAACYADQSTGGCHSLESSCQAQCSSNDWTCRAQCLSDNAGGDSVTLKFAACLKDVVPGCAFAAKRPVPPTFLAYNTRFLMPSESSAGYKNEWYSWEAGPLHVTVLNSYAPFDKGTPQYNFLEGDLAQVNRTATPWLVVVFHCPWCVPSRLLPCVAPPPPDGVGRVRASSRCVDSMRGLRASSLEPHRYNTDVAHHGEGDAMKAVMEPLLFNAQVALVVSGHVHAMERTYPVYQYARNSRGPVYLVLGDGGNREGLATQYYDPQPVWSAFRQVSSHTRRSLHVQAVACARAHCRPDPALSGVGAGRRCRSVRELEPGTSCSHCVITVSVCGCPAGGVRSR